MFSWHAIPFARVLLPYIIGIFTAIYLPIDVLIPFLILMVSISTLMFFQWSKNEQLVNNKRRLYGFLFSLIWITLGFLRTFYFNEIKKPHHFSNIQKPSFALVSVSEQVVEKAKFYRCYAQVIMVQDSLNKNHKTQGQVLLYFNKTIFKEKPFIGNQYVVSGNFQAIAAPSNPGEFNYKQYLSYHNVHFQMFAQSNSLQMPSFKNSILRQATHLREVCRGVLTTHFKDKKVLGVAEALLLGYKDDLDAELVNSFSQTGTLHVLAVSGLHAGIIYGILVFLTSFLLRFKRGLLIQTLLIILSIWLYAFVTGLSSSVLRSSLMFTVVGLAKLSKRKGNIFNTIYISAFILLVFNPLDIVNVSFQLSYIAVLGIVFVQPQINKWYIPNNKFDGFVWSLISVSFAAQLLTFPLGVFYFHQFPNYFLFSNLFIIPLTMLILAGLLLLLLVSFIPYLGTFVAYLIQKAIMFNNFLVDGIFHLPGSHISGLHISFWQLILLFTMILLFVSFFIHKSKWILFAFLCSTLLFLLIQNFYTFKNKQQKILTFHNINHHDVFTAIEGQKVYIISDTGFLKNDASIKFFLEPYFWEHGVNTIIKCDLDKEKEFDHLKIKESSFQFFNKNVKIADKRSKLYSNFDFVVIRNTSILNDSLEFNSKTKYFISNLISPWKMRYLKGYQSQKNNFTKKYYQLKL